MSDIFYQKRESNYLDNLVIDLKKIYHEYPIDKKEFISQSKASVIPFQKIYNNRFIPLKIRKYVYHLLYRTNIDATWIQDFQSYWSTVLHGRPLRNIHDFFFFKNVYRMKFQDNQVPDTSDSYTHLKAWQNPELLYQIFSFVANEVYSTSLGYTQHISRHRNVKSVLEFGCGIAPITKTLFDFYYHKYANTKIYISDIQTVAFHYAAYRFRDKKNVIPILLIPENDFMLTLNDTVDVIFCKTVFEHLNKPLETIKIFKDVLNKDGLLIFDYIKSEGEGLDTMSAVRQRNDVLDYIRGNFEVSFGTISKDTSTGLTVVRKR